MRIKITKVRLFFVLAALPLGSLPSLAQDQLRDTLNLKVFFKQGISSLDLDYMGNRSNLEYFVGRINSLAPEAKIDTLKISAAASPEGGVAFNRNLSIRRAESIRRYVLENTRGRSLNIVTNPQGENWDGLLDMLRSCTMPWVDEARAIILQGPLYETAPDGYVLDHRKRQLQSLNDGQAWAWMLEHCFPELRRSVGGITCVIDRQDPAPQQYVGGRDTLVISHRDTIVIINENYFGYNNGETRKPKRERGPWWEETELGQQYVRKPVMALRTNLLLPAMNVGIELPLGNRWSFEWDHYYPWAWRNPDHRNCVQALGEYAGFRFWFGETHKPGIQNYKYRFTGHSLALIAAGGYYDFEKDFDGFRGEYMAAGLDYTYALPIAKGKMRMEFDIAAGYFVTVSKPYDVFNEGGYLIHRDGIVNTTTWIGPIKAGINLVVPITKRIWLNPGDVEAINGGADIRKGGKNREGKK